MVRFRPSTVFVKDPVDVWGKEETMGLSELAVRTHAPPLAYDRRGDVIFWDDFESPTAKFTSSVAGAGTVIRSNTVAKIGDFSAKCTTGTVQNQYAGTQYSITDFHLGKIGVQTSFASNDSDYEVKLINAYYDGTNYHMAYIKYVFGDEKLYYQSAIGPVVWTEIAADVEYRALTQNWSTIKVVFDLSNYEFVRLLAFGNEYDLSGYSMPSDASVANPYLYTSVEFHKLDVAAIARVGYIDNIILTENEPT